MVITSHPVVTGLRQDNVVEILDGVQPGDRLIADGLNKVQPGQPVIAAWGYEPGSVLLRMRRRVGEEQ